MSKSYELNLNIGDIQILLLCCNRKSMDFC